MLPLDRQLWRLFRTENVGAYNLAAIFISIALILALLIWLVLERRSRRLWRTTPSSTIVKVDGGSPYRVSSLQTFLEKAPLRVRLCSLFGIVVGVIGLGWPILFISDLEGGTYLLFALLLEAIGAIAGLLSLISGIAMLRNRQPFGKREATVLRALAFLLAGLGSAYLLHAFDGVEVDIAGIKWHETMPLGRFLRSGFVGLMGGHVGLTWRLLLHSIATYGLMSAGYFWVWARLIVANANANANANGNGTNATNASTQEGDGLEVASPSA